MEKKVDNGWSKTSSFGVSETDAGAIVGNGAHLRTAFGVAVGAVTTSGDAAFVEHVSFRVVGGGRKGKAEDGVA